MVLIKDNHLSALARELPAHQLEFSREVWMDVCYKGEKVGSKRVDFVIDEVMVETGAWPAFVGRSLTP